MLRLQFAPVPVQALDRALACGVESYLRLYGVSINDTKSMARAGSMAITRWTNQLRALQRIAPGHEALMCVMRRAAFTNGGVDQRKLLFVPSGFDSTRSLDDQGESLWWTSAPFCLATVPSRFTAASCAALIPSMAERFWTMLRLLWMVAVGVAGR